MLVQDLGYVTQTLMFKVLRSNHEIRHKHVYRGRIAVKQPAIDQSIDPTVNRSQSNAEVIVPHISSAIAGALYETVKKQKEVYAGCD